MVAATATAASSSRTSSRLGADRSASVSTAHANFGAAVVADKLLDVLSIYADLVRVPHLPEDQLEDARQVCLHEVRAVDDDPAQKVMQVVRQHHYPDPWGRPSQGEREPLEQVSRDDICRFFQRHYSPRDTILSVAGNVDWPRLKDRVGELLGDWTALPPPTLELRPADGSPHHIPHSSNQTHIAIAYASVPYGHKDYYQARGAVGVLSDGMSSRLFTEVRETRGLCYAVYATCHSLRDRGSVLCYAGTSTQRAPETLRVLIGELTRLAQGIQAEELGRLKARIKSSLIMQQESSPAQQQHRSRLVFPRTCSVGRGNRPDHRRADL